MNYIRSCIILLTVATHIHSQPSIINNCGGSTGNQLFLYCFARILSDKLGMPIIFSGIPEFPETYKHAGMFNNHYPTEHLNDHSINLDKLIADKSSRNISMERLAPIMQYRYFKPYARQIRENWLRMNTDITPHHNPNDVVVHIRVSPPPYSPQFYLPFSYYEKALASIDYDQVYICVDLPENEYVKEFIKNFERYNPIIMPHESIQENNDKMRDFRFIMSFNKIIAAQSSYSWWAAYLSKATEIIAPKPLDRGWMSPERPEINIACIDEPRYKYVTCTVGKLPWE